MRRATSCTQVSMMRTQRKKRTVWFVFLFVGAVYASQMAQLRLRAFARNTSCCICSLCPLCSISANAVRLRLSSLVVYRDLPNSDCYRRSIACSVTLVTGCANIAQRRCNRHSSPLYKKQPDNRVVGGDNRTRTCDPSHVKRMLYQLSHASK